MQLACRRHLQLDSQHAKGRQNSGSEWMAMQVGDVMLKAGKENAGGVEAPGKCQGTYREKKKGVR